MDAFRAAIAAGADAVYLGLQTLNARRGARNFSAEELPAIVAEAHSKNIRVYLTLNIDLTQRELGQAVRMLKLASDAGVDAVLVRDPAVIHLRRFFPTLQFHFSTQTCIANSADVLAAGELGASRTVLARELSLAEIRACSSAGQVETEVFVQGALCFCISGRCMLSSWAGGHSGNRGTCTSPCRVPWTADQQSLGTPLSMKDLTAVHRLADLQVAGVTALKIEGRLKSARWVGDAVGIFADAKADADPDPASLFERAQRLGAYTGRDLTDGYLDAQRDNLTAQARGRAASSVQSDSPPSAPSGPQASHDEQAKDQYSLSIDITDSGIVCTCEVDGQNTQWTLPKTVVHREKKAITIARTLEWLKGMPIHDRRLGATSSNHPDHLLVPRAANGLPDAISVAIRQLTKPDDPTLRLDLPEELRSMLAPTRVHPANSRHLGDRPDRVRLEAKHVVEFVRRARASGRSDALPSAIIVEAMTSDQITRLQAGVAGIPLIVALPPVFFEGDIPAIRQLTLAAVAADLSVEVNTWGGWLIARQCSATIEAGPCLPVLNTLAAAMLHERGCKAVSLSQEIDRKQLEEVSGTCPVPCCVTVFGRPALMITRVKMDRDAIQGRILRDRRGMELKARLEHGLWTLRPTAPFDLRRLRNNKVRAAHLVMDLVASPAPAEEWLRPIEGNTKPLTFNYGRSLQ